MKKTARSLSLFALFLLLLVALGGVSHATAVSRGGTINLSGSGDVVTLQIDVGGSEALLGGFTFGLFDLGQMTADIGDPDFQLQALQADHAIILHECGQAVQATYSVQVSSSAKLGIFLLPDATIAQFSRGQSYYDPIFSLVGSPGSYLIDQIDLPEQGITTFAFSWLEPGMAIGGGAFMNGLDRISLSVSGLEPQGVDPVVPEPATLALVGLGVTMLGLLRRRRSR